MITDDKQFRFRRKFQKSAVRILKAQSEHQVFQTLRTVRKLSLVEHYPFILSL